MSKPPAQIVITGAAASTLRAAAKQEAIGRIDNPLPADHPAYASIGRVTAEWAHLEHALDVIIWEMAGVRPDVGSCITGQMIGHAPRFNAIGALGILRGLSANLLKEIENTGNSISGLAKERNRIVHDAWYFEPSTGQTAQFRSVIPKKKVFGIEAINDETVQETVSKIVKKRESILRIRAKINDALSSLR